MTDLVNTAIVTVGAILTGYLAFSGKREDTKQNNDKHISNMFSTQSDLVKQLTEQVTSLTEEISHLRNENEQVKEENEKLRLSVDRLTVKIARLAREHSKEI